MTRGSRSPDRSRIPAPGRMGLTGIRPLCSQLAKRRLPLDLTFPEVFRPDDGAGGFHAVFGNPPWDVVHYQTKEFLAAFDPRVMDAPTKRERLAIEQKLLADPAIESGFLRYKNSIRRAEAAVRPVVFRSGVIRIDRSVPDIHRAHAGLRGSGRRDRPGRSVIVSCQRRHHATAAKDSWERLPCECCFTFENRKKMFDIHGRQKFSLIVARRPGATTAFRCAFYLDSIAQLNDPDRIMVYDRDFIAATGGACETFLELRGQADLRVARHMFVGRPDMQAWLSAHRITFGREAHMTDDSHRFTPISAVARKALPLHEGKTFHQYHRSLESRATLCDPLRRDARQAGLAARVRSLSPRVPGNFPLHRRAHDDRGDHSARSHFRP